jgi:ATP-dependent helicase/DNAse subunit B
MQTNSEPFNESATVVPLPMEHRVESPLAALAMGTPINGGVTLFETQASCPFKAALTFRLKPQIWQEAEYGVSALDRGNWLHAALESFYKAYPRKTAIDSLGEAELAEKVDTCLSETTPRTFQALDLGPLVRLERQWLSSKMTSFIKQDVQRSWTEVTAVEQSSEATIASYPFKIRVDRIDRLAGEDERFVLLDYKSGRHKYPGFIKSPPSDVQLPTYVYYSRLDSANVAGLSLVFVTESAKHRYSHLGNIGLSHAVSDMQVAEALKDTKTAIEGWVTDFTQGLAPATPSKEACSHCQYELICRLKHAKMTHEDDSVQETSDE